MAWSKETELSFVIAFANSISSEISRLATIAADRQKADFIGSVSHELRSPLHGILASSEFLGDTALDGFQKSLVDTVDSCGRTLLDTISHILDYSKINTFERNWRQERSSIGGRRRGMSSGIAGQPISANRPHSGAPALLNIFGVTDVAAICEEVVEGVYAGQVYQDYSSTDLTDTTAGTRGRTADRGLRSDRRSMLGGDGTSKKKTPVAVIFDIAAGDFTFLTQPGALRRLVMNIFGNSLKYTEHGMILVKLSLRAPQEIGRDETETTLVLTVRDSGRGISSHYLRTRLFTPFAQENSLAPGTGLGLSIVRSIVNMLGGTIDIKSELGQGTEVVVTLPLIRPNVGDTTNSTPSTSGPAIERAKDDSISILRGRLSTESIALLGFEAVPNRDPATIETGKVLKRYIEDWYGGQLLTSWTIGNVPNVIVIDELETHLLLTVPTEGASVIVLCHNSSLASNSSAMQALGAVDFCSKPVGPYKFAKVLRICLEKTSLVRNGVANVPHLGFSTTNGKEPKDSADFEKITIPGKDDNHLAARTNGSVIAGNTLGARDVVKSMSVDSNATPRDEKTEYPFPGRGQQSKAPTFTMSPPIGDDLVERDSSRPPLLKDRRTDPFIEQKGPPPRATVTIISQVGEKATSPTISPPVLERRTPHTLLVEDNSINMRLLKSFVSKRKYDLVDTAENGQLAVDAATATSYDVIFMGKLSSAIRPFLGDSICNAGPC